MHYSKPFFCLLLNETMKTNGKPTVSRLFSSFHSATPFSEILDFARALPAQNQGFQKNCPECCLCKYRKRDRNHGRATVR